MKNQTGRYSRHGIRAGHMLTGDTVAKTDRFAFLHEAPLDLLSTPAKLDSGEIPPLAAMPQLGGTVAQVLFRLGHDRPELAKRLTARLNRKHGRARK